MSDHGDFQGSLIIFQIQQILLCAMIRQNDFFFQVGMNLLYIILLVVFPHSVLADVDPKNVRCLGKLLAVFLMYSVIFQYYSTLKSNRVPVCRNVVEEIDSAVQSVDPKRTVEVGSYRLDSIGNQQQKTVSNCVQLSVRRYIFIYLLPHRLF